MAELAPAPGCDCGDAINQLVLNPKKVIGFTSTLYNFAFTGQQSMIFSSKK